MANISSIKLPNGTTYTIVDKTSGYTTNTGTVTSVAASGSGGISISGSPITTSGTIAIGLNLSTAINGLGEGTSNANRNDFIVAQYAGGGTTTTTYHRRSLAHIFAALNSSDITTALGYTPYNSTNPNGYTTNTGTVTSVGSGVGLTGGSITTSGTIKANLTSDTALSNAALSVTEDANRIYPVRIDKNDKLVVVVPWTNVNSSYLTSSSTLNAAKLSGAIPSAVTATTQASTDNSTKIATTAYVTTAIANLPEPMLFKGSVGTGGTVTSLPTAAASNEGWTYKVITALSSPSAKVGDTVISNGSEWVVIPSGDEPSGTVTSVGITNGGGLSVSGSPVTSSGSITISHADTSSQASSSNSGRTYIQSITLDTYGHVTALSTATETVTNTDTKLQVAEVTSATQYYPIVGTGTTAATRQYDTTGFKYKGTTGTTSAVGSAILELGNSTASGTAGNKQAQLIMYGSNAKKATLTLAAPSADIALALPTSAGTLALTSQIPTVPSSTGSSTIGITASTTATKTTLGTAFTIPNVTSVGSASNWVFEDITVPIKATSATTVPTAASSATTVPIKNANATSIPNVTSVGTAPSLTITSTACDDITAWSAGSGSSSLTFAMDTTDTKKLKITFSHTHTAPSLSYTARTVGSASGWSAGTTPTLGTAISIIGVQSTTTSVTGVSGSTTVTGVQSTTTTASHVKSGGNGTAPTLGTAFTVPNVTGNTSATVSITDNGHTHTI